MLRLILVLSVLSVLIEGRSITECGTIGHNRYMYIEFRELGVVEIAYEVNVTEGSGMISAYVARVSTENVCIRNDDPAEEYYSASIDTTRAKYHNAYYFTSAPNAFLIVNENIVFPVSVCYSLDVISTDGSEGKLESRSAAETCPILPVFIILCIALIVLIIVSALIHKCIFSRKNRVANDTNGGGTGTNTNADEQMEALVY